MFKKLTDLCDSVVLKKGYLYLTADGDTMRLEHTTWVDAEFETGSSDRIAIIRLFELLLVPLKLRRTILELCEGGSMGFAYIDPWGYALWAKHNGKTEYYRIYCAFKKS